MKRQILLCLGVAVILLLSFYLGYSNGFSRGTNLAANNKSAQCQAAIYMTSAVPLYKSEFLYKVISNQEEWSDVNLEEVAKDNLQYHLGNYKDNYDRLPSELKAKFEKAHLETLEEFSVKE